jgi:hypothetical protein
LILAAGSSRIQTRRTSLAIAVGALLFGTAAAVYYSRIGLALAHYDARAHLVVARRVFDSLTPGWQQVGAVWLPLPHLLNAIPVQFDWLYRTGYSGIAFSVAAMALACWAIATLIARTTGSWAGGAAAAALLMINPNVLYLQSTPMTEPLLFGTTFLAVALIAEWCGPPAGGPSSSAASGTGLGATAGRRSTRAAGWACVAAVLTRYEAFPIIAAAIGLAFVVLLRRGVTPGAAFRAVRGLARWPLWALAAFLVNSKVTVGAFFVAGGFYVPENPALGRPWLAWTQLWEGVVRLAGPLVPWLAAISTVAIVVAFVVARRGMAFIVVLALAASAALPYYAYYQGHPERIRYAVPLVAASAALIGCGVALLPRRLQPAAALVVTALTLWQVRPFDLQAPVVVEAQREAPNLAGRRAVTSYLTSHWDGQPIFMSMGSLAHYMYDLSGAGFGIRDFLHEGNGEIWKYAVAHPSPVAEWIAIEERAEGGDALNWQAKNDPNFLRGYERVTEGGGVALYRRK